MDEDSHLNIPPSGNLRKSEGVAVFIEWDIVDYKLLFQQKKFGTIARSPTFQMRDATWSLQISHLLSTLGEKLVIVYLYQHEAEKRYHSITYLIAIQVNEKEICGGYKKTFVFSQNKVFCNIAVTEKELLRRMSTDALTVLCTLYPEADERRSGAISKNISIEGTHSDISNEGIDILSSHMRDLLINEENCDFVVKVKSKEFRVHKAILSARSPVLSAMLHHDMAEKKSSFTEIVDCEPDVFEHFLIYLYGGRVEELSWDNAVPLYALGDKYDLRHLRKVCVEFMEDSMCLEAFCDAISLAVKHSEYTLLESAEEFFLKNVKSILVTNKWQLLLKENPVICNELFLKCYE